MMRYLEYAVVAALAFGLAAAVVPFDGSSFLSGLVVAAARQAAAHPVAFWPLFVGLAGAVLLPRGLFAESIPLHALRAAADRALASGVRDDDPVAAGCHGRCPEALRPAIERAADKAMRVMVRDLPDMLTRWRDDLAPAVRSHFAVCLQRFARDLPGNTGETP